MFNQIDLFTNALGLKDPWEVTEVSFDPNESRIDIYIAREKGTKVTCPVCGKECPAHDSKERIWRHLNFFRYYSGIPYMECL